MARTRTTTPPAAADNEGLARALDDPAFYTVKVGGVCHTHLILGQLPDDLKARISAAIDSQHIPATAIADLLTRHGYPIGAHSINRHRRRSTARGCKCPL